MQNPDHQLSKCPKCRASRGEPCTTNEGFEAYRVHYGRPYWSSRVGGRKAPTRSTLQPLPKMVIKKAVRKTVIDLTDYTDER